jgi:hypothetical protein
MKNRSSLDLETDNLNDSSLLNLEPSKSTRSILDSDIFSTGHFDNPTTGEHHHSPLDLTTRNGLRPIMGGKWLPEKPGSSKRPQSYFFCRVCNRSLSSSLLYDRHLQSELHFKRLTESSVFDMDDDIAPLPPRVRGQRYSEESSLSPRRPLRTIKGTHTTRVSTNTSRCIYSYFLIRLFICLVILFVNSLIYFYVSILSSVEKQNHAIIK